MDILIQLVNLELDMGPKSCKSAPSLNAISMGTGVHLFKICMHITLVVATHRDTFSIS